LGEGIVKYWSIYLMKTRFKTYTGAFVMVGVLTVFSLTISVSAYAEFVDGVMVTPPQIVPENVGDAVQQISSPEDVGDVVHQIPSPEQDYSQGLTWDGQYLWVSGGYDRMIYQLDPADGTVINSYQSSITSLRGMTWDGTYLWVGSWSSPHTVYKLEPTTGSVISSFDAPGGPAHGLAWADGFLWVSGDYQIYKINPSDGSIVSSFIPPPGGAYNPRGLAWDGQSIWAGYQSSGVIYQLDPTNGNIITSFASPAGFMQQGLTWDGQYLWSTGGDNVIYKIEVGEAIDVVQFSKRRFTGEEETGKAVIEVKCDGVCDGVSVDVIASDSTAVSPADYTCAGTVTFAGHSKKGQLTCDVVNDGIFEPTEYFYAILDNPVGATLGKRWVAPVNIIDNDGDGSATLTIHVPVADNKTKIKLVPKHGADPIIWGGDHCAALQADQGKSSITINPFNGPIDCTFSW
jgi:hypothetical protein